MNSRTALAGSLLRTAPAALLAGLVPVVFIPGTVGSYTLGHGVDVFILPRASLVLVGGCLAGAVGLLAWRSAISALGSLGRPACLVLGAVVLSTLASIAWPMSLVGSYSRYESGPMRIAYLLLFCLAVWTLRTAFERRLVVTWFLCGCAVIGLEALWASLTGQARPDGNLGQSNLLGVLLAMAVPLLAVRSLGTPLWSALLVPVVGGLVVSSSRSAWLGCLAGVAVLPALLAPSWRVSRWLWTGWAAACLAAIVFVLASPLGSLHADTGAARLHVWRDTLGLVAARPLFGWGPDTFGLVFGRFVTGDWEPGVTFDRAHNLVLDLWAAQGLVGLAACGSFFLVWAVGCFRGRSGSRVGAGAGSESPLARAGPPEEVVGLLGAWLAYLGWVLLNFDWAPATGIFWLLCGVGWSAVSADRARFGFGGLRAARVARLGVQLGGGLALVAAAVYLGVLPLAADWRYSVGDPAGAVALDPLQAEYHRALGGRLVGLGRLREGAAELQLAVLLGVSDSTALVQLGDAEAALGDFAAARVAYRRAVELDPYNGTAQQRHASLPH